MSATPSTPVSNRIRTMQGQSLAGTLGKQPLAEYRAEITEDMAHKAVGYDPREFLIDFLPIAPGAQNQPPKWSENPFSELKDAKKMAEKEISGAMVSGLYDN